PRAALRRLAAVLELVLGDLEVPVAVLVPDEAVDRAGGVVEAVLVERLLDFLFCSLQNTDDPAVPGRQLELRLLAHFAIRAAVPALGVHEHEAGRVPELVAEIAIA